MSTAPTSAATPGHGDATSFDHGTRSRFNAWFFAAFDRYINHITRRHKDEAFGGISPGTVLEIGAGVGANLAYLPPGTRYIAIEPNLRMHPRLQRRCAAAGLDLTILATGAEHIPLPDDSVDDVICSLVLCTAGNPTEVLADVARVLRRGGRFRFVEHVAAPRPGPRRLLQRVLRRPWGWVFEGCDPGRHTTDLLHAAGFPHMSMQRSRFRHSVFYPVNTAIHGIAHTTPHTPEQDPVAM